MPDEHRTRQPGTTKEEWEGGFIPSHSSFGMVSRRQRNARAAPGPGPTSRFSVMLTPNQLRQLSEYADEQALTMPGLVRRLIRKELARGQPEKALLAVRERLGRHKLTALERRVIWGASTSGRGGRSGASAVHWRPDGYLLFLAQGEE